MNAFVAEFLGTALLILLGNGVVSNVVLGRTKGHGAGWIVITAGWGMAVFVAVGAAMNVSGAHLNPAVTVAFAVGERLDWDRVPAYISAQMLGAFVGAVVVYAFYFQHFKLTDDPAAKLACFATAPNVRNMPNAFFCEVVGTFVLVLPAFLAADPSFEFGLGQEAQYKAKIGLGALGALPVGLLVFAIGLSLGGTTGYAINPARDLGPRLAHAVLPIPGKGHSDWRYAWIPVAAPLVGGLLAALVGGAIAMQAGK